MGGCWAWGQLVAHLRVCTITLMCVCGITLRCVWDNTVTWIWGWLAADCCPAVRPGGLRPRGLQALKQAPHTHSHARTRTHTHTHAHSGLGPAAGPGRLLAGETTVAHLRPCRPRRLGRRSRRLGRRSRRLGRQTPSRRRTCAHVIHGHLASGDSATCGAEPGLEPGRSESSALIASVSPSVWGHCFVSYCVGICSNQQLYTQYEVSLFSNLKVSCAQLELIWLNETKSFSCSCHIAFIPLSCHLHAHIDPTLQTFNFIYYTSCVACAKFISALHK